MISGSFVGSIEVLLAPLSNLKTKKQTDLYHQTYRALWETETKHYRSGSIILIRNALGGAAFFGAESLLREQVYGIKDGDKLNFYQKMISSTVCPTAGILCSYPADTLKTHIQSNPESPGVLRVLNTVMSESGGKGLYKGLFTKLLFTVPRGGLSYLTFQFARDIIQSQVEKRQQEEETNSTAKCSP
jgi:hypothetical protein